MSLLKNFNNNIYDIFLIIPAAIKNDKSIHKMLLPYLNKINPIIIRYDSSMNHNERINFQLYKNNLENNASSLKDFLSENP